MGRLGVRRRRLPRLVLVAVQVRDLTTGDVWVGAGVAVVVALTDHEKMQGIEGYSIDGFDTISEYGSLSNATGYYTITTSGTIHFTLTETLREVSGLTTLTDVGSYTVNLQTKINGSAVYGIDVHLAGMKWAAVKSCPVYGGKVKGYDFEKIMAVR